MPLDPARVADVKAWLTKASIDLRAAAVDLGVSPPLLTDVVFHAQQAAEKTLKGFLFFHDRVFRKTHDLGEPKPGPQREGEEQVVAWMGG